MTKHMHAKNIPYVSISFVSLLDLRRLDSFRLTIFGMLSHLAISLEGLSFLLRSIISLLDKLILSLG